MASGGQQVGTNGPHHCIATASTITDMIFRYLRARCAAQGGKLSLEELDDAGRRFSESVPSGFDLFEKINLRCMSASGCKAQSLFTRKAMLPTLLSECGRHAAQASFMQQTARFGAAWMRACFQGMADYLRETVCKDADYQLIAAYVQAAKKLKGKLSVDELLKEREVHAVLRECMAPLMASTVSPGAIGALRETINQQTANTRAVAGDEAGKISQGELQHFLGLMRDEFEVALKNAGNPQ